VDDRGAVVGVAAVAAVASYEPLLCPAISRCLAVRNRITAGDLSHGLTPGLPSGPSVPDINTSFVDRVQRVSDTPYERQCP
jgi:hypothetical protein